MKITRQFMLLVAAFAVATPAAVGGLAYILYQNQAVARKIAIDGNRQTDALFALVTSASQAQGAVQHLVREKDPDNIEKLIEQGKAAKTAAQQNIRQAEVAGGEIPSLLEALSRANEKSIEHLLHGDYGQAQENLIAESNPTYERLIAAIGNAQDASSKREAEVVAAAESSSDRERLAVFTLTGVVLAALLVSAFLVLRRITTSLSQAVDELTSAADGTASAATQISSSAQTLARGSSAQAASFEETAASSEQISSMTERNTQDSQSAAEKMSNATLAIADANARLDELVQAMNEITLSSGKVSKIIKTIDELAFQSNILALNAAVEAARAGEAGMGFAVVADEVRNLAQRSAQAAHDTTGLIDDSIAKTREGKLKLDQVADTIRSITGSAREAKELVDHIRSASEEQARGIQQVTTTLTQMERITQQTAAGAEQSASASEQLFSQSTALRAMVGRLACMVHGDS